MDVLGRIMDDNGTKFFGGFGLEFRRFLCRKRFVILFAPKWGLLDIIRRFWGYVAKVCRIFGFVLQRFVIFFKPCFGVLIVVFSAAVLEGQKNSARRYRRSYPVGASAKKAPRILERGACEI